MRGGARRLARAALVDRDVDDDGALAHRSHHIARHQLRGRRTRHEHGADEDVGAFQRAGDGERAGHERVRAPGPALLHHAQLVEARVEHRDARAERHGGIDRVLGDDASAEDDDVRGGGAGQPRQQLAAAGPWLAQEVCGYLGRHAAGDLAHGDEQRQRAVGQLHGLVGDGGDLRVEEHAGEVRQGGEVEVREQRLVVAYVGVLGEERLFDLDDQLGPVPDLGCVAQHLRAGGAVRPVAGKNARTGAALDEHLVAGIDEGVRALGSQADAELLVLDLADGANDHVRCIGCAGRGPYSPIPV